MSRNENMIHADSLSLPLLHQFKNYLHLVYSHVTQARNPLFSVQGKALLIIHTGHQTLPVNIDNMHSSQPQNTKDLITLLACENISKISSKAMRYSQKSMSTNAIFKCI